MKVTSVVKIVSTLVLAVSFVGTTFAQETTPTASPTITANGGGDGEGDNNGACGLCIVKTVVNLAKMEECTDAESILAGLDGCIAACGNNAEKIGPKVEKIATAIAGFKGCEVDLDAAFPALSCARCVGEALLEAGNVPDGSTVCQVADNALTVFKGCAETTCAKTTEMFESSVDKLKEKLKERLGEDCSVDLEDFPRLQCANCVAGAMTVFLDGSPGTICEKGASATTALTECSQDDQCAKHSDKVEAAIETLVNKATKIAGEDCTLDIQDLPLKGVCAQCVKAVGDKLVAVESSPPTDICAFANELLDSLTNCADVCQVQIDKDQVKEKLEQMLTLAGQDCSETAQQVASFAKRQDIDLGTLQDNITDAPQIEVEGQDPAATAVDGGAVAGGVLGSVAAVGIAVLAYRRHRGNQDNEWVDGGSFMGAEDPNMFYGGQPNGEVGLPNIEEDDDAMASDNPLFRAQFESDDEDEEEEAKDRVNEMSSSNMSAAASFSRAASNPMFDPNDLSTFNKFDL